MFESVLTELPKLKSMEMVNYIFIYIVLPELKNIHLANQMSEPYLYKFDFKDIRLCKLCLAS